VNCTDPFPSVRIPCSSLFAVSDERGVKCLITLTIDDPKYVTTEFGHTIEEENDEAGRNRVDADAPADEEADAGREDPGKNGSDKLERYTTLG
jgi:hypothetical protein